MWKPLYQADQDRMNLFFGFDAKYYIRFVRLLGLKGTVLNTG